MVDWKKIKAGVTTQYAQKAAKTTMKKLGITNDITPENVTKICSGYLGTIKKFPMLLNEGRAKLIKGVETDAAILCTQGKSREQIVDFYWNNTKFQELWIYLGLNKYHLEALIK